MRTLHSESNEIESGENSPDNVTNYDHSSNSSHISTGTDIYSEIDINRDINENDSMSSNEWKRFHKIINIDKSKSIRSSSISFKSISTRAGLRKSNCDVQKISSESEQLSSNSNNENLDEPIKLLKFSKNNAVEVSPKNNKVSEQRSNLSDECKNNYNNDRLDDKETIWNIHSKKLLDNDSMIKNKQIEQNISKLPNKIYATRNLAFGNYTKNKDILTKRFYQEKEEIKPKATKINSNNKNFVGENKKNIGTKNTRNYQTIMKQNPEIKHQKNENFNQNREYCMKEEEPGVKFSSNPENFDVDQSNITDPKTIENQDKIYYRPYNVEINEKGKYQITHNNQIDNQRSKNIFGPDNIQAINSNIISKYPPHICFDTKPDKIFYFKDVNTVSMEDFDKIEKLHKDKQQANTCQLNISNSINSKKHFKHISSDKIESGSYESIYNSCSCLNKNCMHCDQDKLESYSNMYSRPDGVPTYIPYNLKDYKQITNFKAMGGLGPNIGGDHWQQKNLNKEKQKKFAIKTNEQNLKLMKKSTWSIEEVRHNETAFNRRVAALSYAKNVPLPRMKVAKNDKTQNSNATENNNIEKSHSILLNKFKERHDQEKQLITKLQHDFLL